MRAKLTLNSQPEEGEAVKREAPNQNAPRNSRKRSSFDACGLGEFISFRGPVSAAVRELCRSAAV